METMESAWKTIPLALPRPNLSDKERERAKMRERAASITGRRRIPWLRKHGYAARLGGCFLAVTVATVFVGFAPEVNLIWVANGVLLSYLLLSPRKRWTAFLSVGFAAQAAGTLLVNPHWQMSLILTALNLAEVLFSALLLRGRSFELPRFTDRAYLLRFIAFAVVAGPLAMGLIYALMSALWLHCNPGAALLRWTVADGLGAAVVTPACAAIFRARLKKTLSCGKDWIYVILCAAVTLAVFSQAHVPVPFLLYPFLLLVLLRMGLGWAAVATLFVAAVGSWHTIRGEGPFALSTPLSLLEPSILLQVFIAAAMFMLYSISVVLEQQKATESRLQEIAVLHKMVTENSRDVIVLADFEGHRSYVSPAAESVSGWTSEELLAMSSTELMHPEDVHKARAAVRELRAGSEGAMIECRVRKRDGEYLWVEAALRLVRDPVTGVPSGILDTIRDISERKRSEQQLQEAYRAVEALALTDGLTGLANRRKFDQYLTTEWRRSMRDRQPLSLLMLDVDLFKPYNDTYGHQRGDSCLKQIAEACMDVVSRPGDLVARFGGEEFIVILPNTESEGAMQVANEICEALRSRRLPHSGSPFGIVTISIGCATMIPEFGRHAPDLIAIADHALYEAKHDGRNQVCIGNPTEGRGEGTQSSTLPKAATDKMA
jgi:diguanylate cyclase (GGDEF)-like protein/PAS domain S-box-containing protein